LKFRVPEKLTLVHWSPTLDHWSPAVGPNEPGTGTIEPYRPTNYHTGAIGKYLLVPSLVELF